MRADPVRTLPDLDLAASPHGNGRAKAAAAVPLVRLAGVGKRYLPRRGSGYEALRDFNLDVAPGEFFCLLGTSGCGKTTVLNLIAGFERPTSGAVEIAGRAISAPGHDRAVVFQGDDSLYPWLTALANVEFGLRMRGIPQRERRERAQAHLKLVGLAGQEQKYPAELSGGMKQRIQIARVLANEPQILLMDEPFGALDAQTRAAMQEELARIWRATGKTIVFVTHDIDEAVALGTRIGVMRAGPASNMKALLSIDLPEDARNRTDDRFVAVYRRVYDLIRVEVAVALQRSVEQAAMRHGDGDA
jgi:NitT/TauT family transport system ATP-binding protein